MSKAEAYRKLAEEAKKRAASAPNPEAKEMHEQLSRSWEQLADHVDRQRR